MSARLLIMHAPSLPEDCLHNGDLLSASSVSNSPQLLKYLWPCFTDSRPDAGGKTDDCRMRSRQGNPRP